MKRRILSRHSLKEKILTRNRESPQTSIRDLPPDLLRRIAIFGRRTHCAPILYKAGTGRYVEYFGAGPDGVISYNVHQGTLIHVVPVGEPLHPMVDRLLTHIDLMFMDPDGTLKAFRVNEGQYLLHRGTFAQFMTELRKRLNTSNMRVNRLDPNSLDAYIICTSHVENTIPDTALAHAVKEYRYAVRDRSYE